jgi:hypothetical protein
MTAHNREWWGAFEALRTKTEAKGSWFAEPGITDEQVPQVEKLFSRLRAPLPPGLMDLYRTSAEFGCVRGMDDIFAPIPIYDDDINLEVRNEDLWKETGVFRVGDIGSHALSCNKDNRWSVEMFDEFDPPQDFDLEFDEALAKFLEIMSNQYDLKRKELGLP